MPLLLDFKNLLGTLWWTVVAAAFPRPFDAI